VSCQLDKLRRCLPQRIRRSLDELPTTLDETYERTLLDIDEEKWEFSHRLFQCVTVAFRPLRVEELGEFLAFDFDGEGRPIFEEDWRPEDAASAVLSTCSSMISVIKADDGRVVQFSHFSVKEFLTSTRIARGRLPRFYVPLEMSHTTVAQACIFILLQIDNDIAGNRVEMFPLAQYAARHWVNHARFGAMSSHVGEDMRQLFNPDKPHFAVWTRIYDLDHFSSSPLSPRGGPLYYSALCGFHEIADWLVTTCSQDVNARGGSQGTPLMVASLVGFLQIVQLLLKHGANPNVWNGSLQTPLLFASYRGHLRISQLLIEYGADVNASNMAGLTSLQLALRQGRVEIAKLLLESNANPNPESLSEFALPPLYMALAQGYPQVVQLLLHHSADPHAQGFRGRTLLHMASKRGHLNVAQQLLELGADVHVRDDTGWTPFQAVDRPAPDPPDTLPPSPQANSEVEVQRDKDAIRELLLKYGSPRDPAPFSW
jgi:Ankyrin repeats (3 copies)/Ankyrin repeats (many copies)